MTALTIFVFNDHAHPSVYGLVPHRSSAVLPQEGRNWTEVVSAEFPLPERCLDAKAHEAILIYGYYMFDAKDDRRCPR
jgi:hypothetical protein